MATRSVAEKRPASPVRSAKHVLKRKIVVPAPAPLAERVPREINPTTGFTVDSDSDIIAQELIAGGESREDISRRIAARLDPVSRTGTPKPVANLMSGVIRRLRDRGYQVESSWIMVNPDLPKKRARRAKSV